MAQQNTLDFLIAAHVSGQEQMAKLINTVGALQKETERLKDTNVALGKSTDTVIQNGKRYNNALDAQSKALRQARQGSQMAMMQMNDFATSIATGASPIQAFNQQIGQLGYSLSLMQGTAGKVGRFFAGPWGLAVIAATTVLGFFAKGAMEASTKTLDLEGTAKSAFDSISERLNNSLKPAIEGLAPVIEATGRLFEILKEVAVATVQGIVMLINRILGGIIGTINAVVTLGSNAMGMMAELGVNAVNLFAQTANYIITNIENFINNSKNLINRFLEMTGSSFRFAETRFKRMEMATNRWAGTTGKAFAQAGNAFVSAFRADILDFSEIDVKFKDKEGKKKKAGKADTSAADAAKKEAERLAKIQDAINIRNAKSKIFWAEYWADREDEIAQGQIDAAAQRAKEIGYIAEETGKRIADDVDAPIKAVQDSFVAIGNSVADSFKGMLTGAMSWKDGMRSIIGSVIDELWRLYVVQQIVGMVTGFLGRTTGATAARLAPSATATIAANAPLFANGTVNAPGGMAWVGERGPELVNLPKGSQVIPAHRAQSMGGSGVTVNVDARGSADPAAVRAQVEQGILQAAPAIIAAAQSRTVNSLRRPRLGGAMQ